MVHSQTIIAENRDETLIALIREGNMVAFGQLVEQHREFVTRIVSRFLFREEDSQEVIQDTFIRIWKHLNEFDCSCRFQTWIYTIAFNLCLDRTKAIRRRHEVLLTADADYPGAGVNPAGTMEHMELGTAVRIIARKLSKVQRLVFVLRDLQDIPVEEVCRITGFGADKVKSNLYHARKFMREKLEKGGYI